MQYHNRLSPLNITRIAALVAFAWALFFSASLSAQSVRDFSLPSGDESPTPAPSEATQGPVDERSGVEIAPRVIEQNTTATPPISEPEPEEPAEDVSSEEVVQPLPTQAPISQDAAIAQPTRETPQPRATLTQTAPETIQASSPVSEDEIEGPSFTTPILPEPDEAIDPAANASTSIPDSAPFGSEWSTFAAYQNYLFAALALLIALLAFVFLRRREGSRGAEMPIEQPVIEPLQDIAPAYENDLTQSPTQTAERNAPPIAIDPSQIALTLEILSASRSVMMFSIEFRIDVANRSGQALRNLEFAAEMAFAQAGSASGAPTTMGADIGTIERIGPQQSRGFTATLSQPLSQLKIIQQGPKPLFIPLIHLTLQGEGLSARTQSYVVGTPSTASAGRVHPLTLDGPPGGIPGLRAQVIKT